MYSIKNALLLMLLTVLALTVTNAKEQQETKYTLRGSMIDMEFANFVKSMEEPKLGSGMSPDEVKGYTESAKDALEATNLMLDTMERIEGKVKTMVGLDTMNEAYGEFKEKLDVIREIAGDKAEEALVAQARAMTNVVLVKQDVSAMAQQLKDGAEVLLTILMTGATDTPKEELAYLFDTQRLVLLELLDQTGEECEKAKESLAKHAVELSEIKAKMQNLVSIVEAEMQSGSNFLQQKENQLRTDAYAGCIASVVGGPPAVAACYSIAVGVIEGQKIPELKKAMKNQKEELAFMGETFNKLAESSEQASDFALAERQRVVKFKSKIMSQKHIIKALPYSEYDSFKTLMMQALNKLIAACDEYLDV